jgi:hypothetical protein
LLRIDARAFVVTRFPAKIAEHGTYGVGVVVREPL